MLFNPKQFLYVIFLNVVLLIAEFKQKNIGNLVFKDHPNTRFYVTTPMFIYI